MKYTRTETIGKRVIIETFEGSFEEYKEWKHHTEKGKLPPPPEVDKDWIEKRVKDYRPWGYTKGELIGYSDGVGTPLLPSFNYCYKGS